MSEAKILHCSGCGEALDVGINQSFVFCKYCGAKNIIDSQQMKSNVSFGNINISANVGTDNLIQTAEYAISVGDLQKASELLMSAVMSGNSDYRVYIYKAQIELQMDDNKSLFESLERLEQLEKTAGSEEMSAAIKKLMAYRGANGVTVLHNAAFHERLDLVKFCVEHGADVNCHAGMNNVTPLTIMYVPIDPTTQSKLDGTPFVRNKEAVKQIREYLIANGAIDSKSAFRNLNKSARVKKVNKIVYCILALLLGGYGVHKFYAGKIKPGILYLIFCWTYIPGIIAFIEFIIALTKQSDAMGYITV